MVSSFSLLLLLTLSSFAAASSPSPSTSKSSSTPTPSTPKPSPTTKPSSTSASSTPDKPSTPGGKAQPGTTTLPLKDICAKAKFPDLCITSIQSVAPGITSTDERTALAKSIHAVKVDLDSAITKATKDPSQASDVLSYCVSGLTDATDDVEKAQNAAEAGDEAMTIANLDSLGSSINTCREDNVPIKAEADKMYQQLQNCWAIYDVIWP